MKNKYFKTEQGALHYKHYTGTDLFDIEHFPLKDGKQWKDIIGTSGQNAERKAKSIATTAFNYMVKQIFDEIISTSRIMLLGIFGMGLIHKRIMETENLSPETFNKKAVLCVTVNKDFRSNSGWKFYNIRMTKRGRVKLYNSVKIKKRGTVRQY